MWDDGAFFRELWAKDIAIDFIDAGQGVLYFEEVRYVPSGLQCEVFFKSSGVAFLGEFQHSRPFLCCADYSLPTLH